MKAGYARVSTKDQTVDLQVDALKRAGCTKVGDREKPGAERAATGNLGLLLGITTIILVMECHLALRDV
jgi:hypothetical protein